MTRRSFRRWVALAAMAGLTLGAGATAVGADPIMRFEDVKAGMQGEAFTVVHGTDIVSFPVTVTDVQPGPNRAAGPLILVRAEGPLIEQLGGIAQGMSGSPVYVTDADGVRRVIGALAYGQGDEANVLGAVTPIERMVALTQESRSLSRPRVAATRPLRMAATRTAAISSQRRSPETRVLYPLQRWGVAGVDSRVASSLAGRLGRSIELQQALPRSVRPPVTLEPGSSVSVMAMGGDITLGAIGTVTWRDGDRIAAFGHPFTGGGSVDLLMGDAYIYNVVPAPIRGDTFKFGEPGNIQGTFTTDRTDGVAGRVGGTGNAIRVRTVARDTARRRTADLRVLMTPQAELAPIFGDTLQLEPLLRVRDGVLSGTLDLKIVMSGGDLTRPVVYRNTYAAAGDVITVSSGAVERLLTILMSNSVKELRPGKILISQTLRPDIRAMRLVSARVRPAKVRVGQRVRLELTMRAYRGGIVKRRILTRLPAGLGPGVHKLRVTPNDPLGFDVQVADLSGALLGDTLSTSVSTSRRKRLRATLRAATTPARVQSLLRAAGRATDRHDVVRLLGPDDYADDTTPGRAVSVPGLVIHAGTATAGVRVLPARGAGR